MTWAEKRRSPETSTGTGRDGSYPCRDLERAVERMEERSREPASQQLFDRLVLPLLEPLMDRTASPAVLEVGCGTGSLSRRIAKVLPRATVHATDKSEGMVRAARALARQESQETVSLAAWDTTDGAAFPFSGHDPYDLVLSSVMVPCLAPAEARSAVHGLVHRLRFGGVLAFIEQDLSTDSLYHPDREVVATILAKDGRVIPAHSGLGMREMLRAAGLSLLPRESFLWCDDHFGPYVQDLLERVATDALEVGRIERSQHEAFFTGLRRAEREGDFYYGLVYHRIAGRKTL